MCSSNLSSSGTAALRASYVWSRSNAFGTHAPAASALPTSVHREVGAVVEEQHARRAVRAADALERAELGGDLGVRQAPQELERALAALGVQRVEDDLDPRRGAASPPERIDFDRRRVGGAHGLLDVGNAAFSEQRAVRLIVVCVLREDRADERPAWAML